MLKAIKIRLYPNKDEKIYMNKLLRSYRFIYNQSLNFAIQQYNENKMINIDDVIYDAIKYVIDTPETV